MQARDAKQHLNVLRRGSAGRGKGASAPPRRGRGGVSLGLLLEEGLLAAGDGVLSVDYKQRRTLADLCGDGRIKCACAGLSSRCAAPVALEPALQYRLGAAAARLLLIADAHQKVLAVF